ncbi:TPR domain-containing protein [Naegleria gruberi]|uniref:TPR domain-containing protein n=1 Tax=Naegleria gruberi TaxID=5762 RepID=D2VW78_NAEGR|nr:TPR domain-containing protein [Naegleria gruberi]EFC38965.1 TPR domain-containing protein [Naegleria gruberi]|eukprot:XP_002671709.1 TPR domain-containing protein [Naegleria gruberi strain NEG-M]
MFRLVNEETNNESSAETPTTPIVPIVRDGLEVDQILQLPDDDENSSLDLKLFCKLFALDYGQQNLLEHAESNEKQIRKIEEFIFEFTRVESEEDGSSSSSSSEEEEDEDSDNERNDDDRDHSEERRDHSDDEDVITEEQISNVMQEIKNDIKKEQDNRTLNHHHHHQASASSSQEPSSSNSTNSNEVNIQMIDREDSEKDHNDDDDDDNDECSIYKTEPTSTKLNILTLSSLNYSPYEHPDRFEVRNIMYFSNVTKCKLFKEKQFIGISEIIDTFYKQKKVQLPNFIIFQILFAIVEKLYEMNEAGLLKRIPNIEQDEHLFYLNRNRHVEKYHVIERLFLDNVEISPKFKTVFHFQDQVGYSQFVDVNINDNFEKTIKNLDMYESDIIFCLGIFILEIMFSTTSAHRMIFKILSQPYNEPLVCEMMLQENRNNWCMIRIILSMLRINEPYRLVPKPFYENPTIEDVNFVPRITLENLIGIELPHVCTILAEDRKIFEYFLAPVLSKLTIPYPSHMLNNPLHPSSYKYIATLENGNVIDLYFSFLAGIVLYGSKSMQAADMYLRQSVLHPPVEHDKYVRMITDLYDMLDNKENAGKLISEIENICEMNLKSMHADITARFAKAKTSIPFFSFVSYSFLGKALAEMKKYPLSLYYTEYSMVCSKLQQSASLPLFNSSAIFTKAYIVHKYDVFDVSNKLYEQVISNFKGHSMAHNNRGICLKRLKMNEEAIKAYEMSLRIDPSNHLAYNNRAMYFYSDEEHENSMLYYKMAIRLKPTYQLPITNLGLTLTQLTKYADAIELLTIVLEWSPANVNALITRGFCYMRRTDFEEALADYNKLVNELESEERSTLFNMALCYYHTSRLREAIYYASKIISKNPNDDRARYYRALFYEKYEKFEESFEDVNIFLQLSPANTAGTILRDRLLVIIKKITRVC